MLFLQWIYPLSSSFLWGLWGGEAQGVQGWQQAAPPARLESGHGGSPEAGAQAWHCQPRAKRASGALSGPEGLCVSCQEVCSWGWSRELQGAAGSREDARSLLCWVIYSSCGTQDAAASDAFHQIIKWQQEASCWGWSTAMETTP